MATETCDRKSVILSAALRVFARRGFHQATIQQIATEAGLNSPSLIYWYFQDKSELFKAVAMQHSPLFNRVDDLKRRADEPPERVLLDLAESFFAPFEDPDYVLLFRLFISEVARDPQFGDGFAESGIRGALDTLVGYFQHQMRAGRMREIDAQSAARAFIGTLMTYMMGREFFPALRRGMPASSDYAEEVVRIFMDGLQGKSATEVANEP